MPISQRTRPQRKHMLRACLVNGCLAGFLITSAAAAKEQLITSATGAQGQIVPYLLTSDTDTPKAIVILMPGGNGVMDLHEEGGNIVFKTAGNFLIRSRHLFADQDFAAVCTDASADEARIQTLLDDLAKRYPGAPVYLIGTSRGTESTMRLAPYLSDKIAGVIHTSTMRDVMWFDPRPLKNRQLLVHHRNDTCRVTRYDAARTASERYGIELITMEGGDSIGDACEAKSYHGYHGIERETVQAIRAWILRDPVRQ